MPLTTCYKRGDVVLVPFPFTDLTSAKQRPAVVVSPDSLNIRRDDLVLAAITSQVPAQPDTDELLLGAAELTDTGLVKPSVIKLGKLVTIHQDLVRRRIGVLPEPQLSHALRQLQWFFSP